MRKASRLTLALINGAAHPHPERVRSSFLGKWVAAQRSSTPCAAVSGRKSVRNGANQQTSLLRVVSEGENRRQDGLFLA